MWIKRNKPKKPKIRAYNTKGSSGAFWRFNRQNAPERQKAYFLDSTIFSATLGGTTA